MYIIYLFSDYCDVHKDDEEIEVISTTSDINDIKCTFLSAVI